MFRSTLEGSRGCSLVEHLEGWKGVSVDIGRPKRIIEVEPTSLPMPEPATPQSEPVPAGEPAHAPEPAQPRP